MASDTNIGRKLKNEHLMVGKIFCHSLISGKGKEDFSLKFV